MGKGEELESLIIEILLLEPEAEDLVEMEGRYYRLIITS